MFAHRRCGGGKLRCLSPPERAVGEIDLTRHESDEGYLRMPTRLALPCMMVSALALLLWSTYLSRIPLMGAVSLR